MHLLPKHVICVLHGIVFSYASSTDQTGCVLRSRIIAPALKVNIRAELKAALNKRINQASRAVKLCDVCIRIWSREVSWESRHIELTDHMTASVVLASILKWILIQRDTRFACRHWPPSMGRAIRGDLASTSSPSSPIANRPLSSANRLDRYRSMSEFTGPF